MASPLIWKVFCGAELRANVRYAEDAAALVALTGGVVRVGRRIVWREGAESQLAGDSYDAAAMLMVARRLRYQAERAARLNGEAAS